MTAQFHELTRSEQETLLEWAAAEGWNPGIRDAEAFWNLDPHGFLGFEVDGELAGGGAIIRHSSRFGFMGLFIVGPDCRGRKLGAQLWTARRDRLLSRLDPGATIGLDGVDAMVPFYERGGFKPFTRHRRFELADSSIAEIDESNVVQLSTVDFELVNQFDYDCFPRGRRKFLENWLSQPGTMSLGIMGDGGLGGFGVMRPCQTGWKVGPLFADTLFDADQILKSLRSRADGQPVYIDAPDNNSDALELCRSHGMTEVFGCVRMYLGPIPNLEHHLIYGVTTLEVG